jgi:hypothetical protein
VKDAGKDEHWTRGAGSRAIMEEYEEKPTPATEQGIQIYLKCECRRI